MDQCGKASELITYVGPIAGIITHEGTVAWPDLFGTLAACDSEKECKDKIEELCKGAGHGGRKNSGITDNGASGKTCMGDCKDHGAVAFVTCAPQLLVEPPTFKRPLRDELGRECPWGLNHRLGLCIPDPRGKSRLEWERAALIECRYGRIDHGASECMAELWKIWREANGIIDECDPAGDCLPITGYGNCARNGGIWRDGKCLEPLSAD
jgi:hypothetical protein